MDLDCQLLKLTLQGTNISHEKSLSKMIFLLPRWDMLVFGGYFITRCESSFFICCFQGWDPGGHRGGIRYPLKTWEVLGDFLDPRQLH